MAKKRWASISKEERSRMGHLMVEARWGNREERARILKEEIDVVLQEYAKIAVDAALDALYDLVVDMNRFRQNLANSKKKFEEELRSGIRDALQKILRVQD